MQWKRVYGIIPVPVYYVDDLGWAGGKSYGFYVKILKKYKDDRGLLEHELQHCRQFYRTLLMHGILYSYIDKYRYWAEIECYRIQLKYHPDDYEQSLQRYIGYLTTNYNLDLDPAKVEKDLRNK